MIDDKKRAEFDQISAGFNELVVAGWRRTYLQLVKDGFTEEESLDILKTYITTSCAPTR